MQTLTFASTNQNKYREIQSILSGHDIAVEFARISLVELQLDSLEEIAREKAKNAFAQIKRPVIVEDDGLFIDSLNGFPGQYSSYTYKTIGNEGILRLLAGSENRSASFRSIIAFCDGNNTSISEASITGKISEKLTEGGWGYDPIFVPEGSGLTFAQLKEKKNCYSHRRRALEKFALSYR